MREIRITTQTFRLEGDDPSIPDNYVDPVELARIKKLAGIDPLGLTEAKENTSPIDGSIGTEKGEYQRKTISNRVQMIGLNCGLAVLH